jgi:integrase
MARRQFGAIQKLPSGRWRARYWHEGTWLSAPATFAAKADASAWLATVQSDLLRGVWTAPAAGRETLAGYARRWLEERQGLRPRTVELYEGLLVHHVLPVVGSMRFKTTTVRTWHSGLVKTRGASQAAKAYRLLRAILATAASDGLIPANPCTLKGAGAEHPAERQIPTLQVVQTIADEVSARHRALVMTAAYTGLRAGELRGLERRHIDLVHRTITVEQQALTITGRGRVIGPPKSRAGIRVLAVPPSLTALLDDHLADFVDHDPTAPVFTGNKGGPLQWPAWSRQFRRAAEAAGAKGLHFHDLRHLAGTLAAATGASTREVMARLGHSTPRAALIYQHATQERDNDIALAIDAIISAAKEAPAAPIVRTGTHPR